MPEPSSFQRPTFDARIQYYELLRKVLEEGKQRGVLSDLLGWYRCLHITYNMVSPYIEPKLREELRTSLYSLRAKVIGLESSRMSDRLRFQHQMKIDKLLLEIDERIHTAAKRMLLPLESGDDTEFDIERFMRESDLAS